MTVQPRCEVCGEPTTVVCSGLDVPELRFCEKHGVEHEKDCPDIARGAAWISRPGVEPEGWQDDLASAHDDARKAAR